MSNASHEALVESVKSMRSQEMWSLKNQLRHEGKNEGTDRSIAISRIALPAFEEAVKALDNEDYNEVIEQLTIAVKAEG